MFLEEAHVKLQEPRISSEIQAAFKHGSLRYSCQLLEVSGIAQLRKRKL